MKQSEEWQVKNQFLELRSKWLTVIGEYLKDNQGQILEYWRVEKADSVVVLPIQNNSVILPPPSYRPGVGKLTLDFPGGRVRDGESPEFAVSDILLRELGISEKNISKISALNTQGWMVNSSFSNQKLYGFVAEIQPNPEIDPEYIGAVYPINSNCINDLLKNLHCLQCRAIFMQWWLSNF
ncbi:NUDIX hydrolase [Nodularia harveyana UHCC-0300]|uniref:NUDIX hydrolase n=1 Tax=Nodularia harveyana UHCC-0300 TaxID=2974287 RepID=A0ABU5UA86_9CYAN|nr:NUDIX hydrolase [Nodularia harveyana]MEA5580435.1 NUDIX hydrolase [Nodularia harveyana UHCC-0300]